ncbi:MAG: GNAT family N-acetyltransferase [Pyrinomonadaceae bacterium]
MLENESVKIRFATVEDAAILAEISRKSFYDAFKDHPKNEPEDMRLYMDSAFGAEIQARELADPQIIYLIVEAAGEIAGFVKLHKDTREETVTGDKCLEIARFYLLQEWIGRGVSKQMMQMVLDYAQEKGFDTVWLGVWEYNYRAQAFYKKWGFEHTGEHIFQLGNDPQTDWVWQRKV